MPARNALLTLLLLVLAACTPPVQELPATPLPSPEISIKDFPDNFPKMDSSTSAEPVLATIACEFLGLDCLWMEWLGGDRRLVPMMATTEDSIPLVSASGTHQAYLNLISGQARLILVARPPSFDESALAANNGVELDLQPVALDAFVLIVNDLNPVEELTTGQVRQIYSGKLANWKEVGWADADIHPYQRDDESGSQELMRNLVMRGTPMISAPDMVLQTMVAPFNTISVDAQGIGYSVYYYEENMAPEAERVKPVAIDGVAPTAENIRDRSYPYTTEVYAVTLNTLPRDSLEYRLKEWLGSPAGQQLIEKSGYVALK